MHVHELMTPDPKVCLPTDGCATVGEIMRRRNCGFVPVVDDHVERHVVGVVTDRDLALFLTRDERPAREIPVEECMTRQVETIGPESTLDDAAKMMKCFSVHRLPVVKDDRLIGVLSLTDIAVATDDRKGYGDWLEAEEKLMEITETLAASR